MKYAVRSLFVGLACLVVSVGAYGEQPSENAEKDVVGTELGPVEAEIKPLTDTLREVHEFSWGLRGVPDFRPDHYIRAVLELQPVQRLIQIAREGDDADRAELLDYSRNWVDAYINAFPAPEYLKGTENIVGVSRLTPGMDAVHFIVLAELDPSWETLKRLVAAANSYAETSATHASQLGRLDPERGEHFPGGETAFMLAYAAKQVVEQALEEDTSSWLDNQELRSRLVAALAKTSDRKTARRDYAAVLHELRYYSLESKGENQ